MTGIQALQQAVELRMHTINGVVHCGDGREEGRIASGPVDRLESLVRVVSARNIYLFGTRENAEAIVRLYDLEKRNVLRSRVFLGGISAIGKPAAMDRPDLLFKQMLALEHGSSGHGWHSLTSHDYVQYALLQEVAPADTELTPKAEELLLSHPAWPAISFLRNA